MTSMTSSHERLLSIDFAAGDYEPRSSNSDLYQIWYKSKNHARPRAESTGWRTTADVSRGKRTPREPPTQTVGARERAVRGCDRPAGPARGSLSVMSRAPGGRPQVEGNAGRRLVSGRSSAPSRGQLPRVQQRPPSAMQTSSRVDTQRDRDLRSLRPRKKLRRFVLILAAAAVVIVLVVTLHRLFEHTDSFPAPSEATLAPLSVRQRIVTLARSQVGYSTEPSHSYCNKFSDYWNAGTAGCPGGEKSEEWCADFAAWAWQKGGVDVTYGYGPDEINGAAASFYEWGVANGEWHPASSGFVAAPGDVAVYGLSLGAVPSAVHVAIVTDDVPGQPGPDVVNGDGDRTGFSVVETGTDQVQADAGNGDSVLAGYVSPPPAT